MPEYEYSTLWNFICAYLPNYYSRDDVLRSDILRRYIDDEYVAESDLQWIDEYYGSDRNTVTKALLESEKGFVSEALENYYITEGSNLLGTLYFLTLSS